MIDFTKGRHCPWNFSFYRRINLTDVERTKKFDELRADQEFGKLMFRATSPEAIVELFASRGVEVDLEDAQRGYNILHEPDDLLDDLFKDISDDI